MIPQHCHPDTESDAERRLFALFRERLPSDFTVLHAVPLLLRRRPPWQQEAEVDFLIVHRALGWLALEVKGGLVTVDGAAGAWSSTDRRGDLHPLKRSPFDQARGAMHAVKEKLAEAPATRGYRYRFQHGVALPDMVLGADDLGPDAPRASVIGGEDLDDIERAVRRLFGRSEQPQMAEDAYRALIDVLKPTTQVARYALRSELVTQDRQMVALVENQYRVMDLLRRHRRVVIAGCAGSGKTLLAMEKARRLANEGFDVLLTCYNRRLAAWIRAALEADPGVASGRITVRHFHELADVLCRDAGLALDVPDDADARNAYFRETLPDALFEAIATNDVSVRFDAIVVDEGQDFADAWWITLTALLRDPDDGVFYVFHDEGQRLYQDHSSFPFDTLPIELTNNLRNTRLIHREAVRYLHAGPTPVADGPEGRKPEIVRPMAGEGVTGALARIVSRLVNEEGIDSEDIIVLTPRSQSRSALPDGLALGSRRLTWRATPGPNAVQVATIHSWKGLESAVVILAETDALEAHRLGDVLPYVALTRARHHVVAIGPLPKPRAPAAIA
jgi:hypothetical protein